MHDLLTHDNFLLYCAQHYDNPQCVNTSEFIEDVNRIKYIKKLITRYCLTGELKDHLILNHITVLYNVFGAVHTPRILYLKMCDDFKYIKPFLVLLSICPDKLYNINNQKMIDLDQIEMDPEIVRVLRKISTANEEN